MKPPLPEVQLSCTIRMARAGPVRRRSRAGGRRGSGPRRPAPSAVGRIAGGDGKAPFEHRQMLAAAGGMGVGGQAGAGGEGQLVDLMAAHAFGGGQDADGDAAALRSPGQRSARVTSIPGAGRPSSRPAKSSCRAWVRAQRVATVGQDSPRSIWLTIDRRHAGQLRRRVQRQAARLARGAQRGGQAVVDVGAVGHAGMVAGKGGGVNHALGGAATPSWPSALGRGGDALAPSRRRALTRGSRSGAADR